MTGMRAREIERLVIYANIEVPERDTDPETAFHFGRMVGRMHERLRIELEKEIVEEDKG